jgi:NAD(P)-dependent dehydrogenase (short-subunit alcohol dehydrogenase family)
MTQQVVLITGASSGIGRAAAQAFAEEGYRVLGTSRRARPDAAGVEMLELDVRSDDSVRRCVAEVLARTGRIDVLVNNAGVLHMGVAEETTPAQAREVFETNFFGVARVTDAMLPGMRERRQGRVINVGSAAAWVGEPGEGFYSASKHALAGYTEALRHEVRPFGIHVCLVEPGAFKTGVLAAAQRSEGTIADYDAVRSAASQTLHDSLRKGDPPAKVAKVIVGIARARRPRLRYAVGSEARWLPYLRVLLPQRSFDYALRRAFGLPKPDASAERRSSASS